MSALTPTLLLILDGWGIAPSGPGNAVSLARTPNLDRLLAGHPRTELLCSGRAVGLPPGFMGNSEVGHMNLGAGRVIWQDMTRIDLAIEENEFPANPALNALFDTVSANKGRMHCLGLISDGGVHSHINHLHALLTAAKARAVPVVVHAFMDGRDTPPSSGLGYLRALQAFMDELGWGEIASVTGRYYAMDRDKRWDRVAQAHAALTGGQGRPAADPLTAVQQAYDAGETDEFIHPTVVVDAQGQPRGLLRDGDGVFFFNFRADRARELTRSLFDPAFADFERTAFPRLANLTTMTEYDVSFGLPTAFPPIATSEILAEVVSGLGLRQLRIAETEKYAHVTYFFNCGREEPFPGEERVLVPSPRDVATYDLKPEMSAAQVTDSFLERWNAGDIDFAVCNLAILDMVGHTGIIPAVITACETVDACVGRIVEAVLARGGRVLLTADHGNAEEMIDADGQPQTAHSKNPVNLVLIEGDGRARPKLRAGVLGDIAPTILALWGVSKPARMTGESLLVDGGQRP